MFSPEIHILKTMLSLLFCVVATGIGQNTTYKTAYRLVLYLFVLYVVPLTILTITNVTLISTLYRRRCWRNTMQVEVR